MNFLFPEHGMVFIHIPKNAGTSIRAAFAGPTIGPVGGKIPQEWKKYPSFTVIRHPTDRFLSAVNMFRAGARNIAGNDHYREARLPDLTPNQALDVLEDTSIGYDRSVREPLHNLKHHLWPQTDPFNCLDLAEHLLRYETLEDDFRALCARQGLELTLPFMRQTSDVDGNLTVDDLTVDEHKRIAVLFRQDFEKLGYDPEDLDMCRVQPFGSRRVGTAVENQLTDLWPAYFAPREQAGQSISSSLPSPDVDLAILAEAVVPGIPEKGWTQRKRDLRDHFQHLEPEFAGKPRICHLLACTIVVLRRDAQNPVATRLFRRIVREHAEIATHLNSRWLTSVCDTLVDVADNDLDRVLGLTGTLFSNSMKLIETEIRLFYGSVAQIS